MRQTAARLENRVNGAQLFWRAVAVDGRRNANCRLLLFDETQQSEICINELFRSRQQSRGTGWQRHVEMLRKSWRTFAGAYKCRDGCFSPRLGFFFFETPFGANLKPLVLTVTPVERRVVHNRHKKLVWKICRRIKAAPVIAEIY